MPSLLQRPFRLFGSFGLSCTLLLFLGLLTWLGTLEQVHMGLYDVQKKYFESLYLIHWAGPVPIPLPGAYLVMLLLFTNLVVGGVIRMRGKKSRVGILITHFGILFLLLAGFIKLFYSEDGYVRLYPGDRSSTFKSYYRKELVLQQDLGSDGLREFIVPQEMFMDDYRPTTPLTLHSDMLPFDLVVTETMRNSRVQPKGPMFNVDTPVINGAYLKRLDPAKEAEHNLSGAYVSVVAKADGSSQEGILWQRNMAPWVIDVAGQRWAINLREEQYPMPFTIVLDEFRKEDHPGMGLARSFESDVTLIEGSSTRELTILMNEPLRDRGLVVYQSGWGPQDAGPGVPLFSSLAVVRNPADQFPLYACIVIAAGLVLHFSNRLARYVRAEGKAA
jgi:hypothetical protein